MPLISENGEKEKETETETETENETRSQQLPSRQTEQHPNEEDQLCIVNHPETSEYFLFPIIFGF